MISNKLAQFLLIITIFPVMFMEQKLFRSL
ncbi:Uncharacterised protein [Serratia marcescens]|nr:Uncharacterised protein [Serratia marcescens]CAI0942595.1 Uncharacterised protein [Serratia marcescens]CAI1568015.1 Uncharacterised protein [Serratia marcescens]CAI1811465.1 Uncharacterised protein [Serratia marcescens]